MNYLQNIGTYFLMIAEMFRKPTKRSVMMKLILKEIDDLVIGSLGIVAFISFFVGGVITIQTALNITKTFELQQSNELVTVAATAATGTINVDSLSGAVYYYTANATGNWTFNFRGTSSLPLSSVLDTGRSVTIAFMVTNSSPAYYPTAITIDSAAATVKWSGGTAPTSGNVSSVDLYTYTIIKTSSTPTYTVFGAQTKFA